MLTRRLAAGEAPKVSERRERLLRGSLDRTMRHGGIERTYRVYVPRTFDPGKPDPLVIALHGGFGTGKGMEKLSAGGFNALADRHGFVVAYPDGIERHWNDGRTGVSYVAHREKVDDVGFIGALMDALVKEFGLDPGRVYVTGASNGAMMCYRLALEMPTRIAAIAPVMCPLQTEYATVAVPEKVPVLLIHGTDDPLAPFGGGPISSGTRKIGEVLSVEQTVRLWVDRNHASPTPVSTDLPDVDPDDGTRTRQQVYPAMEGGAEVVLCTVTGGGHTWPGGWQYLRERFIGKTSRDFDAATVIWHFFRNHARKPGR
jgi:polyhydroxybutyrate depolymerase